MKCDPRRVAVAIAVLALSLLLSACSPSAGSKSETFPELADNSRSAFTDSSNLDHPRIPASTPATDAAVASLRSALIHLLPSLDNGERIHVERLIPRARIATGAVSPVSWDDLVPTGDYVVVVATDDGRREAFNMGVGGGYWILSDNAPALDAALEQRFLSPHAPAEVMQVSLLYNGNAVDWWVWRDSVGEASATPIEFVWDHWDPQFRGADLRQYERYPLDAITGPITAGSEP